MNSKFKDQMKENPISKGFVDREKISNPIVLGQIAFASPVTQTTIGAAGGASALPATPLGYIRFTFGDTEVALPYYNP